MWIEEVTGDTNFPRASSACLEGLHSAFGFPIRLDKEVLGVIEFLAMKSASQTSSYWRCLMRLAARSGNLFNANARNRNCAALTWKLEKRVNRRTAELHRTQEELRQALKQEQELSRLKSNFVTLVSHQFRTPLGIISSQDFGRPNIIPSGVRN